MFTYVLRRLVFMIPTLIGVTFLIFMLIALSPGGVGAALRVAGGGQTEATNRALQEAYLEDRYGLDDPVFVQYLRWLGRVSPIKFGTRDQIMPTGELIRAPKAVKPPLLADWWTDPTLGDVPSRPVDGSSTLDSNQDLQLSYRRAADQYARDRAAYIGQRTLTNEALGVYLRGSGHADLVPRKGDIPLQRLNGLDLLRSGTAWNELRSRGERMMAAYSRAEASRAQLAALFAQQPFPEAGFPIIPGALSIAPPDLGHSFARGRPVLDLIGAALPVTLLLNLTAFPIIYLIAIPSGVAAATRAGKLTDVTLGTVFVALWSIPTVWAGVMAIGFLANKQYLGLFPVTALHDADAMSMPFLPGRTESGLFYRGYLLDTLWHMALPVACLVYSGFAVLSKQTRAAMLDNFNMDYVRTAKAKGVAPRVIVFAHVFRNSLLPLITMFAAIFPAMLAGSVVIERIFSIPGMGSLLIEAINLKDRELILANAMMIALVNMLALLLADLLYAAADPRISYS